MIYGNILQKRQAQASQLQELVEAFIAKGGEVTIAKPGRKAANTFLGKGGVFGKGAKATNLKNMGIYLR